MWEALRCLGLGGRRGGRNVDERLAVDDVRGHSLELATLALLVLLVALLLLSEVDHAILKPKLLFLRRVASEWTLTRSVPVCGAVLAGSQLLAPDDHPDGEVAVGAAVFLLVAEETASHLAPYVEVAAELGGSPAPERLHVEVSLDLRPRRCSGWASLLLGRSIGSLVAALVLPELPGLARAFVAPVEGGVDTLWSTLLVLAALQRMFRLVDQLLPHVLVSGVFRQAHSRRRLDFRGLPLLPFRLRLVPQNGLS